jgi:hypothetical protein
VIEIFAILTCLLYHDADGNVISMKCNPMPYETYDTALICEAQLRKRYAYSQKVEIHKNGYSRKYICAKKTVSEPVK